MITLITDFGQTDPFVGVMKGVILGIDPEATIVDITHGIPPQDVFAASMAVEDSYLYFPPGTVHVVVVDPGVGSARKRVLVEAGGHLFVGPDNGVFTGVVGSNGDDCIVRELTATDVFLKSPGRTFEGRDVFAPAAAWLSRGTKPEELGAPIDDYIMLDISPPQVHDDRVEGEVVYIDHFGNAITNIRHRHMKAANAAGGEAVVRIGDISADLLGYYSEASGGQDPDAPHALFNSSGRLEIFVYSGDASRIFSIAKGEKVKVSGRHES